MSVDIPDEFVCPISLELMKSPTLLTVDGYTYDEDTITQYVREHFKSPMTRERATPSDLVPNTALAAAIAAWNGRRIVAASEAFDLTAATTLTVEPSVMSDHTIALSIVTQLQNQPSERPPVDIVCLLDASSSMNLAFAADGASAAVHAVSSQSTSTTPIAHTTWSLTLHATRCLASLLTTRDRLSVVLFGDEARVAVPPTFCSPAGRRSIYLTLATLGDAAVGRTNLMAGLMQAVEVATTPLTKGVTVGDTEVNTTPRLSHIVLLTDGDPTSRTARSEAQLLHERLAMLKPAPVVHVVGFGYESMDVGLMGSVARVGGGEWTYISDASMLPTTIVNLVSGMLSTAIARVEVAVEEVGEGAAVRKRAVLSAGGDDAVENTFTQWGVQSAAGSLKIGQQRRIVHTIDVPSLTQSVEGGGGADGGAGCDGVVLRVHMTGSAAGKVVNETVDVDRQTLMTALRTGPAARVVAHHVRQQTAYALRSAAAAAADGDFELASGLVLSCAGVVEDLARPSNDSVRMQDEVGVPINSAVDAVAAIDADDAGSTSAGGRGKVGVTTLGGRASAPECGMDGAPSAPVTVRAWANAVAADLKGEAALAVGSESAWRKWGQYYIPVLARGHAREVCTNFKDDGLQAYVSPAFVSIRAAAAKRMVKIPVQTASVARAMDGSRLPTYPPLPTPPAPAREAAPSAPVAQGTSGGGGVASLSTAPRSTRQAVALPAYYYDRGGGCVHPDAKVELADGSTLRAGHVARGMRLIVPTTSTPPATVPAPGSAGSLSGGVGGGGPAGLDGETVSVGHARGGAVAVGVVEEVVHFSRDASVSAPLAQVGDLWLSAWHPVWVDGRWVFARDAAAPEVAPAAAQAARAAGAESTTSRPSSAGGMAHTRPPYVVTFVLRWETSPSPPLPLSSPLPGDGGSTAAREAAVGACTVRPCAFRCEGVWVAALGHGVEDGSILSHAFLGTERVVEALRALRAARAAHSGATSHVVGREGVDAVVVASSAVEREPAEAGVVGPIIGFKV